MNRNLTILLAGLALAACQSSNATSSADGANDPEAMATTVTLTGPEHPGFQWANDEDGRLWVWPAEASAVHSEKHVTLVGAGPGGQTIKALDKETALAFLVTKPGFRTKLVDGRIHVWEAGAEGELPEKHVTFIAAGPLGTTVKAIDREVGVRYLTEVPGFRTEVHDGRIYVWKAGETGDMPEKHVTRVSAGPLRMTVKATDKAVLDAYLASV